MEQCNCPDPKLCQKLKFHLTQKQVDIWNGKDVPDKISKRYRQIWELRAGLNVQQLKKKSGGGCCH